MNFDLTKLSESIYDEIDKLGYLIVWGKSIEDFSYVPKDSTLEAIKRALIKELK